MKLLLENEGSRLERSSEAQWKGLESARLLEVAGSATSKKHSFYKGRGVPPVGRAERARQQGRRRRKLLLENEGSRLERSSEAQWKGLESARLLEVAESATSAKQSFYKGRGSLEIAE